VLEQWGFEAALLYRITRQPVSPRRQQRLQAAMVTKRFVPAAEMFSDHHQLGVVILPIVELVFCVRMAPTQTSNGLSRGHQW